MKTSVKDVMTSGDWQITKVMQGSTGRVRINAKRRWHVADESDFFCEWCSKKYADALCRERYGERVDELSVWHY